MVDRAAVLAWLAKQVPQTRIQHILRVESYAIELAQQHHLDGERTAEAALLHDLAKYFPPDRLLQMAQAAGIEVDAVLQADPHLLHAPVGAIVAQQVFQVQDEDVLTAIANHTLGMPEMSPMSCAIFLADSLEPGRGDNPDLDYIRKISRRNLHHGVRLMCDRTLQHLVKHQKLIHPRLILTRNWAMVQDRD